MTRSRVRPLTINSGKSPGLGGASCCSDSATATGTSLSPSLFAPLKGIGTSCNKGAGAVSETSGGSSTGSIRPPEEIHPEQIEMTSNGSANAAPRGTRAKELNNAETGGRNDILPIILANGASYDFKEHVALRRFSLEMRRGNRKCGLKGAQAEDKSWISAISLEVSENLALGPADTMFCEGEAARSSALSLLLVQL